jgi:hypothetical protein
MQYSIAVHKYDLRPQLRPLGLQPFEQFESWSQFSKSKKSRYILFLQDNIE